jgi:putative DNA primase/helicase
MRPDTEAIRVCLRLRAAEAGEALLGAPTHRSRSELRWGRKGSLALAVAGAKAGLWHDYESGTGGDLLALVMRERGCGFRDAVAWARAWTNTPPPPPPCKPGGQPPPAPPAAPAAPDDGEREQQALKVWREAREDITNTPAETYLRGRGIDPARLPPHTGMPVLQWPPALRWHAGSGALIVAVNDAASGLVRACQRIFLAADGSPRRRPDGSKLKLSLGPIGGRAARFAWEPDPQGRWALAEGCETALAAAMLLGCPVWASLGASNMPRIAPPAWAREAIICADHDDAGLRAAQEAARRLRERGLQVRIVTPEAAKADAADVLKEVA